MIYTTGTIAGSNNTITGTGTNFTAAGSLIRVGCTLIAFTNPVQVLQITGITSATALAVTPAISPAISAGTKYAILLSDSLSVDGLAQDIAETFGMYQRNMSGFADVMNGSGDVTITINGQQVTVPGQKSLAKKGANKDITSLTGLTTALSVAQGGTGAKNAADARANLGLKDVLLKGDFGVGGAAINISDGENVRDIFDQTQATQFHSAGGGVTDTVTTGGFRDFLQIEHGKSGNYKTVLELSNAGILGMHVKTGVGAWTGAVLYGTANTTKASDGTLKAASPVVKIFSDGSAETNAESEGCVITRLNVGQYLIEGCIGMNADASWGGIDGGFDIPKDRNGQALVWLDYEVNADGSVLVKTFHRTYPDSPVFARNEVDGLTDGEPVDIPADQFVSVRVEMPQDSVWNTTLQAAAANQD